MMANAPATFMLALRPAIGMVTFMDASAMISGAMPSSSLLFFPKQGCNLSFKSMFITKFSVNW